MLAYLRVLFEFFLFFPFLLMIHNDQSPTQRGWEAPSANAQQKTKPQTHACAILGGGLFGYFLVLQKVLRPSVRERI